MKKNNILALFLCLLSSCNTESNNDSRIFNEIAKRNNDSFPCKINMPEIIREDWEKMYVFDLSVSLETINQILGFQYPYFEDVANRIVFVKDKKVIYHEDYFPLPEKLNEQEVVFALPDSIHYKIFAPGSAQFHIDKISYKKGFYFVATPANYSHREVVL
jgi:hypothetical protein